MIRKLKKWLAYRLIVQIPFYELEEYINNEKRRQKLNDWYIDLRNKMIDLYFTPTVEEKTLSKNLIKSPKGTLHPKYIRGKKYFFDGQIWWWR